MKTTDFLGNQWDITCMGCAIGDLSMPVPGGFVHRTPHFCVHQDPLIPLPGCLVIASLRHIRSILDMQEPEYEEFAGLVRSAHSAIKEAAHIEHLTLVQEESSAHFHLWFFPWTQGVVETYGQPSLAKIRDIIADVRRQSIDDMAWNALQNSIENIKQSWRSR